MQCIAVYPNVEQVTPVVDMRVATHHGRLLSPADVEIATCHHPALALALALTAIIIISF